METVQAPRQMAIVTGILRQTSFACVPTNTIEGTSEEDGSVKDEALPADTTTLGAFDAA
jgi:hypothetical protein